MKVRFFLFLFLLTTICRGQLPFDYKDEYGPQEDFFGKAKGFTQRKDNYTLKTLQQI